MELIQNLISIFKNELKERGGLEGIDELYKWKLITEHSNKFNVDDEGFMEYLSKVKFNNLMYPNSIAVINNAFIPKAPNEYRNILRGLFDESVDVDERTFSYVKSCAELYSRVGEPNLKHSQEERVAATLLAMKYPDKYTFYMPTIYKKLCKELGVQIKKQNRYSHYLELLSSVIRVMTEDDSLQQMINKATLGLIHSDILNAQTLVYQMFVKYQLLQITVDETGLYDCDVNITEEEWISMLQDENVVKPNMIDSLTKIYYQPEHKATCSDLAKIYSCEANYFNTNITNLGKAVQKKLDRFIIVDNEDINRNPYWPIPMRGRRLTNGLFEWTMRDELARAMERTGLVKKTDNNNAMKKYIELLRTNKNLVLTGAPGTGKTYLAKEIAKVLVDGDESRIGFVQFHPSYDYTDFVEGLRAEEVEDGGVTFKLRNGIFKEFCRKAIDVHKKGRSFDELYEDFITNKVDDINLVTPHKRNPIKFRINSKKSFEIYTEKTRWVIKKELIYSYIVNGEVKDWRPYVIAIGDEFRKTYTRELKDIFDKPVDLFTNNKYVFIIDEINRGEISKIFGELFFSIDPGYRGQKGKVKTQYSNLHSYDTQTIFDEELGKGWFYVPENVYVIGTMNDIDRSVESMDFAMRRRFTWVEVSAESRINMLSAYNWGEEAKKKMKALNDTIESIDGLGSSYHIGPAYFLKLENYRLEGEQMWNRLWDYHIDPLLREYLRGMLDAEDDIKKLKEAYDGLVNVDEDSEN